MTMENFKQLLVRVALSMKHGAVTSAIALIATHGVVIPYAKGFPPIPVKQSVHPPECETNYRFSDGRLDPHRGHFSLAVSQRQVTLSTVIARVSLLPVRPEGYLKEKLIGDFRFNMNQRVRFIRGLNPGDRVVVRLFTPQKQLIGYSTFELMRSHVAVNLVLPAQPLETPIVRTVVGIDANRDDRIDAPNSAYSYYTKLGRAEEETNLVNARVTFINRLDDTSPAMFQVSGLPNPDDDSNYSCSLQTGIFTVSGLTLLVFTLDLAPALTAPPWGARVDVINLPKNQPPIDVTRQINRYGDIGKTDGTNEKLPGVID